MFESFQLKPSYNGGQYLLIFIIAIVLDMIVHFFSSRKYYALKSGTDVTGFAPELMVYYRSLHRKGPLPVNDGPDSFYSTCNSWIISALITGSIAVLTLLLTDLILNAIDYRNSITG
jgi:hypothetical protein